MHKTLISLDDTHPIELLYKIFLVTKKTVYVGPN